MAMGVVSRLLFGIVAVVFVASLFSISGLKTGAFVSAAYAQQSDAPQQQAADSGAQTGNAIQQLLAAHPNGGDALAAEVSALVTANPDFAADILAAVAQANPDQAKALGAGLASAVQALNATDPEAAAKVSAQVAASPNQAVKTAFLQGSGDQTAALPGDTTGATPAPAPAAPAAPTGAGPVATAAGPSGPSAGTLSVGSSGGGTGGGGAVSPN